MLLNCEGRIVRVEERNGRVGVAVRIVDTSLKPGVAPPPGQ